MLLTLLPVALSLIEGVLAAPLNAILKASRLWACECYAGFVFALVSVKVSRCDGDSSNLIVSSLLLNTLELA